MDVWPRMHFPSIRPPFHPFSPPSPLLVPDWIFTSWESLGRVLVSGLVGYIALVVLLRTSGKRTLSKMNAFDFVVTIAFGSVLAAITLNKTVSLAEGLTALAFFVGVQFAVTWLSVRSERFQSIIKGSPTILFYDGDFIQDALRKTRMTEEEVLSAIRRSGAMSPGDVGAVVLETEGTLTVMQDLGHEDEQVHVLRTVTNPEVLPPSKRPEDRSG